MATKTWWAPIWRDLVVDAQGKHYRQMKNGVWLMLYLILHADRRTGSLRRKIKTIANDMAISEKTLRKWLKILRAHGYVGTRSTGRCTEIVINKWKTIGDGTGNSQQSALRGGFRVFQRGHSELGENLENSFTPQDKSTLTIAPNDMTMNQELNNDTIDHQNPPQSPRSNKTKIQLAVELSQALRDPAGLAFYVAATKRHSEETLRGFLAEVMSIPETRIKTSRGALFNHLVHLNSLSTDFPHDVY